MSKSNKPKIGLWDLETGYNVVTLFDSFPRWLNYKMIRKERYIICGAIKELGSKKMDVVSIADYQAKFKKDPSDDSSVVRALHKKLSKFDALIAHNGDKFDLKYFNTRAVFHGLPPLPPTIHIDTLKIAKKAFLFNSNRLDYLGKFLGVGHKIRTTSHLWWECLNGKKGSVDKMVKYNKQDVHLLEAVYNKLAPYVPARLNLNHWSDEDVCPHCGSKHINYRGYYYTRAARKRKFQCQECGHWGTAGSSDNKRTGIAR